jgi:hypothetical protein
VLGQYPPFRLLLRCPVQRLPRRIPYGDDPFRRQHAGAHHRGGGLCAVKNVWETATPALPAATLRVGDAPVLALGFTPGGEELHVATPHLADRILPLDPDRAARTVCARMPAELTGTQWRRWFPAADHRRTCGT